MVRIIMHGCNGHMGQVITGIVKEDKDAEIVAGIDLVDNRDNGYPVFKSLKDCDVEADVVIDFASAKAEDALIDACLEKKLPVVVCTTGLSEEQLAKIREVSREVQAVWRRLPGRKDGCPDRRGYPGSRSFHHRYRIPELA